MDTCVDEREMPSVYHYLRQNKKFPTVWCPGCGIGIVLKAIIRAVDDLGLDKDKVAMVSGIGCSGRMAAYVDFNTLHTTHGRALSFATGLKLAKPEMKVIVVMGDGDAMAIGGNHFIHTAARNMDLAAIIINNLTYGLTRGQYSPTTPFGSVAATAPYGSIDQPFDICKTAEAVGATFVARSVVTYVLEAEKFIARAIDKKGFSVVEIMSNCHTYFGRSNQKATALQMMNWLKDITAPASAKPEDKAGKIERGIFVDKELPDYLEHYKEVVRKAREMKEKEIHHDHS